MERNEDIGAQIMAERLTWGVEIVKEIAEKHGIEFNDSVFIKGIEAGISMFIQKEKKR